MGKLNLIQLLLIGGGLALVGYGAWVVFGGGGPRITASPNPVRSTYTGFVQFTLTGFTPLDTVTGTFTQDDGSISPGTVTGLPVQVDANGEGMYIGMPAAAVRFVATGNGGGHANYNIMGSSGRGAKVRLYVVA